MSMKPGAITIPVASTSRFARVFGGRTPTSAMIPSFTQISAVNPVLPDPSSTVPPRRTRSKVGVSAGGAPVSALIFIHGDSDALDFELQSGGEAVGEGGSCRKRLFEV